MNRSLPPAAAHSIRIGTVVCLIAHFTLTLIYVMPPTPLRNAMAPLLRATIGTWFPQNWNLFAPEPIDTDVAILLRPLAGSEIAGATRSLPEDGWIDVSGMLWKRFQDTRLSAYDRVIRAQSSVVRDFLNGGMTLGPWALACSHGDSTACGVHARMLPSVRAEARADLGRIGSSFCNELPEHYAAATHFALRVRSTPAVPWSLRGRATPRTSEVDLGVWPIDRSVAPSRFLAGLPQ